MPTLDAISFDASRFTPDENNHTDQSTGMDLSRFTADPADSANKEAFIRAQLQAQNVTPDKAVNAKNDSKQLGINYEDALNNPEIVKQRKIAESAYYDDLAKRHPSTALFMTDHQNYAIAQGDEEKLGIFEQAVKSLDNLGEAFGAGWRGMAAQDEGKIYFDKNILGKDLTKYDIKSHSRAGANKTITGEQRLAQSIKDTQLYGQETQYYAKQGVMPDMARATGYGFANLGYMAKNAIEGLFTDVGQLASDVAENPTVAPMLVGAAATAIASKGKIDPTKALKAKDVGAKLLGADLAAFVVTDSFKQNTNEAHQLYTGVRDEAGQPMPADIARTAAIMSGALNASLDAAQMGMITKTFSPVVQAALKKLGKKGMNEALAEALKRKGARDIIQKYVGTASKLVLAEGAVEGTQSLVKDTIRLIAEGNATKQGNAKFVSPTLFEGTDKEESMATRAAHDSIEAMKSTFAIGFLGASPKAFAESRLQRDITKFEEDKAKLDAINAAANGTETATRDPETIARLARTFGGDADTKQLFMDADKTNQLFQSLDSARDPVDIISEMFGQDAANRFSEALTTSTSFAVPFDAYVSKVMVGGLYEQVKEFTTLNASSLTAEDIANFEAMQQQHLEELRKTEQDIASGVAPNAVKQVYDDVYGQIESLNLPFLSKKDRQFFATVWAKKMATQSIREHKTPDKAFEMYDKYKLNIVNEASKLHGLARGNFDNTIDPLIDSLRTGAIPKESEIYGDTLQEALRKLGISDDRGDLNSMDVDKELKPFTRKMLRDDGMSLDDAAQWAADNGYIQDADSNSLLAAIESDLRGNPVYNMTNPNEEKLERKQKLDNLQKYLDEQGININEYTNDELKALLSGDNTLYQGDAALKMMAIHNLSAENLKYADDLGGMPVPSIAVVTSEKGGVDGFGEITLLGDKNLVDPKKEPVFSADAYTIRFPEPDYGKVKVKDADRIVKMFSDKNRDFFEFSLTDQLFNDMVNYPKPKDVLGRMMRSITVMSVFLDKKGFSTPLIYSDFNGQSTLTEAQLREVESLYDVVTEQLNNAKYNTEEQKQLDDYIREKIKERMTGKPESLIESVTSRILSKPTIYMEKDYLALAKPQLNTQKIRESQDKIVKENNLEVEFKQWVDDLILPVFGEPTLKVSGKKKPYTLHNIVDYMTDSKVKGKEDTSTFGAGQVRAASSVKFKDVEQMRLAAESSIVNIDDYELAKVETQKLIDDYQAKVSEFTTLKDWKGNPNIWEAMDASMRALAKWASSGKLDKQSLKSFLTKEDFKGVPDSVLEVGLSAGKALLNAPVPYFEAKPQRAVYLSEFSGAVIPANATQETRDILTNAGVQFREYQEGERAKVLRELAYDLSEQGKNTLFQEEQKQIDAIRAQYEGTDQWMKAPNGEPTKYGVDSINYFQQSNSIPIYRIDTQGFNKNIIKPHGLYVSIPSDVSTFSSPHKEVGDTSFSGYATPKNPLNVDSVKIQHKRGNDYPMETSAGVSALKQLVNAKLFDSLIKADKAELTATIKDQFPDIDTSQYHDAYELLEVLGAQLAKQDGYDAIIQKVEGDPMNEMVILDNSIIGDLNSNQLNQGYKGYLSTNADREMVITLGGNADFSTLLHESAHMWLEMMMDDLKSPNVTQQLKDDWVLLSKYFASYSDKAKSEIMADFSKLESDVKKLQGMKKRNPKQEKEFAQKLNTVESHKKAIAMMEANPDLLVQVATDFGASIGDNAVKNILTKPYHEQFARSMEAYFREGKAPSSDLIEAFASFKNWLAKIIYPFLKMLGVTLSDEVRGVFDRMIATDAEIESVQQIQQAQKLFDAKMLKEFGLNDEQIVQYERLAAAATTEAEDKLLAKAMQDSLREQQSAYKEELDGIKAEVEKELSQQLPQIILHFLRTGQFKEGTDSLFPIEATRLDKADIVSMFDKEYLKRLPRGVYGFNGTHPDLVADAFGVSSGSKMMEMLINEPLNTEAKRKAYVEYEAKRRMNDLHPDFTSTEQLATEAQKAIHGSKRAELLIAEINALSKKTNKPFTPAAMLHDFATRQFDKLLIEDINSSKYLAAERRINRETIKNVASGDYEAALVSVQKALFNHYMYDQAVKVESQIEQGVKDAKRYDKKSVRENIAKGGSATYIVLLDGDKIAEFPSKSEAMAHSETIDGSYVSTQNSYLEMIDSIRGAYNFKVVPKWLIKQQDMIVKLYKDALAEGISLPFDPSTFATPKSYKKLTFQEFSDVIGAMKVIEKVSSLARGMETRYGKMDMNEVLSQMEQATKGLKSRKVKFEHNKHFIDIGVEGIDAFGAFQSTIDSYVHALDGVEVGIFHDVLTLPQRKAFTNEQIMLVKMHDRLEAIFTPVYKETDKKNVLGQGKVTKSIANLSTLELDKILLGNRVHLPSLNTDLSIQDIMGMAWLMGHQGGRDALTHEEMAYNVASGGLWTEENILKALEVLTPTQLKAVNEGWVLYDKYWPELEALDMRTKGYAPPKVEAIPYMIGETAMTGGYSRLMYNKKDDLFKFNKSDPLETMEDLVSGMTGKSQTNAGSTIARVGSGGKPPRLDFGVMDEHLQETIHDIANREMVIQTYKLITNVRFMKLIDAKLGEAALSQFKPWVVRIAKGEVKPTSIVERMIGKANNASSIMFLGLSLFNAIQNATGLPVAAGLLGGKWLASGMAEFAKNPSAAVAYVMGKSDLIYVRRTTNQYSNDAKRTIKKQSIGGTGGDIARLAFVPQQIVQNQVDLMVWLGAYRKATAGKVSGLDPLDDAAAVAYADRMIENTQSSGAIKDLSNLFARGEFLRMLTLMGSYFNMIFNMGRIRLGKRKYEPMTERYFNDCMFAIYVMAMPVLITTAMRYTPPDDTEDLDDWMTRTHAYRDLAAYPFSTVVIARAVAGRIAHPEFGFSISPSQSYFEGIIKGSLAAGKVFDDESEFTRKDTKAMIEGIGYAFALPTKSVYKSGEPLYDYIEGNESGEDELRVLRSIIFGKPREN